MVTAYATRMNKKAVPIRVLATSQKVLQKTMRLVLMPLKIMIAQATVWLIRTMTAFVMQMKF